MAVVLPQPDGAIFRAGSQQLPVRVEGDRLDSVPVLCERLYLLAAGDLHNLDDAGLRAGNREGFVWTQGNTVHSPVPRAGPCLDESVTVRQAEQLRRFIIGTGHRPLSFGCDA